jgi:transposase InsO family protein
MCEAFGTCRSAYYRWVEGGKVMNERAREDAMLKTRIKRIHKKSRETYGRPRMVLALQKEGYDCGKDRVARLMREEGLQGQQKKRFNPYSTDSNHGFSIAPNLLGDYGPVSAPDEVWVADITYIRVAEGWVYLAAVLDLYSRKIVGWSMSSRIDTELTRAALRRAIKTRGAPQLHHSDRGSQYASDAYQKELKAYGISPSMSRSGNPYDNATMESFFGTLKAEEVRGQTYSSRHEARTAIFSYIEAFYNTSRIHTSLPGGNTPIGTEEFFFLEKEKTVTITPQEERALVSH